MWRHKTAAIAACGVFLAVAGGTAATVWEARIAVRERADAVRRFNDVRQLAHAFLFDFNDSLKNVSGSTAARKLIVARGLQYLDTLPAGAGADLALIRELGSGYIRVGDVQGNPVVANLGDSKGAIASYRKAVAILEPLAAKGDYESRSELAVSLTRLADLLWTGGDSQKALIDYRRALDSQEKPVAERPSDTLQLSRTGYNRNNIGDLLLEANDLDNAEASYRKGLEISQAITAGNPKDRQARLDLALSEMKLGDVAWYRGDWKRALEFYRIGTGIREALLQEREEDSVLRHTLIASYSSIGDTLAKQHDLTSAVTEYRKALKIADTLARSDRPNHQAQRDRLVCLMNLSELLEKRWRPSRGDCRGRQISPPMRAPGGTRARRNPSRAPAR